MIFISGSAAASAAPHSRVLSVCGGSITNSLGMVRSSRLGRSLGQSLARPGWKGAFQRARVSAQPRKRDRPMATSTGTNRKKLLLPTTMSRAGWALVEARDDVAGVALGVQPFSDPELDAAPELEVVSRIGVGYDAVDVPALTRRKIPLMIGGTANSVSVAEAGVYLIMSLARRGAAMDKLVREGRWEDRYKEMPVDLYGKTVLIIGFGKIGTRAAKRYAAMETHVLIYDPYMYSETIRGMGYEPVADLDAAVARADFITIHCPKTPETTGLFNAARLAHMKRTAFI